jgi:hypothetical protein
MTNIIQNRESILAQIEKHVLTIKRLNVAGMTWDDLGKLCKAAEAIRMLEFELPYSK